MITINLDKLWRNVQPLYDLYWPFWDQIWNPQGLSFLQTPKNWKLVHIWRSYSTKRKIRLKLLRQLFSFLRGKIREVHFFQNSIKIAKSIFDNFYVLGCHVVKYGLIFDFLGSAESWDPEDFKSGLKKTK